MGGLGGPAQMPARKTKPGKAAGRAEAAENSVPLSAECEALAARLREWRATEAKRLRVPAYVVLHDRTLNAVARVRPKNPRQLLEVDGIGQAKVDRFGAAILELCAKA